MSVTDPALFEFNGKAVLTNKEWIKHEIAREIQELNVRYRNIFENVNFELSRAF
jgi:hypothetical protein